MVNRTGGTGPGGGGWTGGLCAPLEKERERAREWVSGRGVKKVAAEGLEQVGE